ncbi:MAG: hypothetical protein ABH848_02625 [Candidatus Omnitrophota bacterium]
MKIRYEIDPYNQLIARSTSRVKKFRKIVNGTFKIDKKNDLYFEAFKSQDTDIPQKIKFSGKFSLDKKDNIIFTLDKWNNQIMGNRLRFKTQFVRADSNSITFLAQTRETNNKRSIYSLSLSGYWKVYANNRLIFNIKRSENKRDNLVLQGSWNIGKNNEVIYKSTPSSDIITFKGKWTLFKKYTLGYSLDRESSSGFNFKTSLGYIVSKGKDSYLGFDIDVDIYRGRRLTRKVLFKCTYKKDRANKITLEISPGPKEGLNIKLKKEILDKEAVSYIEALITRKERYIGGGMILRW